MSSTSSSRLITLGLCLLLLFHGCLAQLELRQPQRQSRLSGRSECRFDRITAREPNRRVESEAGVSEFWFSDENDELDCAGVEVVRHIIQPKGLLLPYYPDSPELAYVVRGRGIQGTVLPGCPETFETSSEGGESRGTPSFDKHQRVYRYKEGDILALPAGAVHWTYNDGDTPITTIVLRDTSNVANQLDRSFRKFFLAGNPQSQQLQEGGRGRQEHEPGSRRWDEPEGRRGRQEGEPGSRRSEEQEGRRGRQEREPGSRRREEPEGRRGRQEREPGSRRREEQEGRHGQQEREPGSRRREEQEGQNDRQEREPGSRRREEQEGRHGRQEREPGSRRREEQEGRHGRREGGQSEEQEAANIFNGFADEILQEVYDVNSDTVRQLKGQNDDRGVIVFADNFQVVAPEEEEEQEQQQGRRSPTGRGGRGNGIEETICSTQLRANIANPARADVYNPRGGRITSLNSHKLPILDLLQLSAERGVLYKNAVLAPHFNLNSHSIVYVTSGNSRLQIVRNDGTAVFDDVVREGQLIVVPQDFAVVKKAGEQGFEWVAFKTNDNAITTQLAGRFSVIRSLPEDVLVNSYDISRDQAKQLKYNRQEGLVLSPRARSTSQKGMNALLNAIFS